MPNTVDFLHLAESGETRQIVHDLLDQARATNALLVMLVEAQVGPEAAERARALVPEPTARYKEPHAFQWGGKRKRRKESA